MAVARVTSISAGSPASRQHAVVGVRPLKPSPRLGADEVVRWSMA